MVTESSIISAGFRADYPNGAEHPETRQAATQWHNLGTEGILSRSASLARLNFSKWEGDHELWSELAIFTDNAVIRPSLLRKRNDLAWLAFRSLKEELP